MLRDIAQSSSYGSLVLVCFEKHFVSDCTYTVFCVHLFWVRIWLLSGFFCLFFALFTYLCFKLYSVKVSFDSTKHLSDASIKKRQLERQKLQELEKQREEQKRREKEAEEKQREEER